MDKTPPSHLSDPRFPPKSASRLSRLSNFDAVSEGSPRISLEIVPCSPKISAPQPAISPPSTVSPKPRNCLPIHELLLLSPSRLRRSKTRLADRIEIAEEATFEANGGSRRGHKNRNGVSGPAGCASPKSVRRSRRRLEPEIREEKDLGVGEEAGRARKKRQSGRSKKEKLSLAPSIPSPKTDGSDGGHNLEAVGRLINDLVMWKDVAKSSLWFGFGSLCFLSSCLVKSVNFSIFSLVCQLGLLFLGFSFFSHSIFRRNKIANRGKLTEDDILKVARLILPAVNLAISKARELFSGEPSMTLKVAPFLLLGAEYGSIITFWRLSALGFFISFTGPKLYSFYCAQINIKVEYLKSLALEAWGGCSHKKIVAASAATAFWNLTTIKTQVFAAFISLVVLRYYKQHSETQVVVVEEEELAEEEERGEEFELQEQRALVLVEQK